MTHDEEQELLELARQNHYLLTVICAAVLNNTNMDFIQNVIANIVGNQLDPYNHVQRSNSLQRKV